MNSIEKKLVENLRYERKYLTMEYSVGEVEQILKYNIGCFSEIYSPRTVNNIYFDTLDFHSYNENVTGDKERLKIRIRWYGSLFGEIKSPQLEFKIKNGLLGYKKNYELNPFVLDSNFNQSQINAAIYNLPISIRNQISANYPTLLNSYFRKYYISKDKKIRVTIDSNLKYYKINYTQNYFLNKTLNDKSVIVELKYGESDIEEAMQISNDFPFTLTKNSKYLTGVDRVLF